MFSGDIQVLPPGYLVTVLHENPPYMFLKRSSGTMTCMTVSMKNPAMLPVVNDPSWGTNLQSVISGENYRIRPLGGKKARPSLQSDKASPVADRASFGMAVASLLPAETYRVRP